MLLKDHLMGTYRCSQNDQTHTKISLLFLFSEYMNTKLNFLDLFLHSPLLFLFFFKNFPPLHNQTEALFTSTRLHHFFIILSPKSATTTHFIEKNAMVWSYLVVFKFYQVNPFLYFVGRLSIHLKWHLQL